MGRLNHGPMEPAQLTELDLKHATIGILTALPKEYAAVKAILNKGKRISYDGRHYWLTFAPALTGENLVVVHLLVDVANNFASAQTTQLLSDCPRVHKVLMVGIAGAVPFPEKPAEHVRLGDIVVSDVMGVVQYDYVTDAWQESPRHRPRPPDAALVSAYKQLLALEYEKEAPWISYLAEATSISPAIWSRPSEDQDVLLDVDGVEIPHPSDTKRQLKLPNVFHGPIASANALLKNPAKRDKLRDKYRVKAVEMEASGVADATWLASQGYIVIRGTCDYCDDNKNDVWQDYAAIVASSYARALLEFLPKYEDGRSMRAAEKVDFPTLAATANQFKDSRIDRILEGRGPDEVLDGPVVSIHVVPLQPRDIDIFQSAVTREGQSLRFNNQWCLLNPMRRRPFEELRLTPNTDRLLIQGTSAESRGCYLQIFRNGSIELVDSGATWLESGTRLQLGHLTDFLTNGWKYGKSVLKNLRRLLILPTLLGVNGGVYFSVGVLRIAGLHHFGPPYKDDHLEIPDVVVNDVFAPEADGFLRVLDSIYGSRGETLPDYARKEMLAVIQSCHEPLVLATEK